MDVREILDFAAGAVGELHRPVMLVGLEGWFDVGGSATTRASWGKECIVDFASSYDFDSTPGYESDLSELDDLAVDCVTGSNGDFTGVYNNGTAYCGYSFLYSGGGYFLFGAPEMPV